MCIAVALPASLTTLPVQAQGREPITPENARRAMPLAVLSYGYSTDVAWSPDGKTLAVATSTGVLVYDATMLRASPPFRILSVEMAQGVAFSPDNEEQFSRPARVGSTEGRKSDRRRRKLVRRLLRNQDRLVDIYRRQAKGYDRSGIHALEAWRRQAVKTLNVGPGDLVIDIGCGTGLNFARLEDAVGPEGRIIGVDLTDAMLDQARQRISQHGWTNVELVQVDAAAYDFPNQVNGIISTFALTFIPDPSRVITNGSRVLAPGRQWVVLDMAWPAGWPLWWRKLLFFLPSYGITDDVIQRRPWQTVWETMNQRLVGVVCKQFWLGFFYLMSGKRPY